MLHLVNRLLLNEVAELRVVPVLAHLGMQKILIDRGELFSKRLLQRSNNLGIAFHLFSF